MSERAATLLLDDEYYDGQPIGPIAKAVLGLADVGEAVATARAVGKPDPARWYAAWSERARAVQERAATAADRVSARNGR